MNSQILSDSMIGYLLVAVTIFTGITLFYGEIGYRGLKTGKPFLFPTHRLMWMIILCYVPNLLFVILQTTLLIVQTHQWAIASLTLLGMLAFGFGIYTAWLQARGYLAFGITEDSFRDALLYALQKRKMAYEETISRIRLTDLKLDLAVVVAEWTGTAQLRLKEKGHEKVLDKIVAEMNAYYATTAVAVNPLPYRLYLALAILIGLLDIALAVFGVIFFTKLGRF